MTIDGRSSASIFCYSGKRATPDAMSARSNALEQMRHAADGQSGPSNEITVTVGALLNLVPFSGTPFSHPSQRAGPR